MAMREPELLAAVGWYRTYLVDQRRLARGEISTRLEWIEDFCDFVARRRTMDEVMVRDVVCYFAEKSDKFDKPYEWYARYKVIECFCDDLVEAERLTANKLKGIYDDGDVEPYNPQEPMYRVPAMPVNWSRIESVF